METLLSAFLGGFSPLALLYVAIGVLMGIIVGAIPGLGAGMAMKVGPTLDRGRFFVAFDRLPAAQELVDGLFTPGESEEETE